MVTISKTSIAAIEQKPNNLGVLITLKEKRPNGENIVFDVELPYTHIIIEINKYEKIK